MSRFTQTMTRLQPRHRAVVVACAALLLLVTTALLVPRGDDRSQEGALAPVTRPTYAARDSAPGPGVVSAADRAEIDRVLATAPDRISARLSATELARRLVRCAEFEGQRYCLGVGWTTADPELVRARATAAPHAASRSLFVESTGDLSVSDLLAQRAALTQSERLVAERTELEAAARGVAKVVLLRHQVLGEPVPDGFLERHPEARATAGDATAARSKPKTTADYPRRSKVLSPKRTSQQQMTYWCGPTTMQMIAWGWKKEPRSQRYWANQLGTTTSGSAISEMVRVVNSATGWDGPKYAGDYIVLDISDWSYKQWLLLQMRHFEDYRAPVVLHPILLRKFYPYLDDDASGHFQVGRGYDKRGRKPAALGYFEPWNQQRFDPSEPFIARVQWRSAYQSFRANQAHPHQNIGV